MAEWINQNVEDEVKSDLDGLQAALTLISCMPKDRAERVLRFCAGWLAREQKSPEKFGLQEALTAFAKDFNQEKSAI